LTKTNAAESKKIKKPALRAACKDRTNEGKAVTATMPKTRGKRLISALPSDRIVGSRRRTTKKQICIDLLERTNGASIADLQKATGWQEHSIRAALTGLRKSGMTVERGRDEHGVTVYRITGES
jgi:hypothetical protein